MKLKLVPSTSKVLKRKANAIGKITDEIRELANAMVELLTSDPYASNGIGLAAPQVGWGVQLLIVKPDIIALNPKIVWRSDEKESDIEGCLSLPGMAVRVERHKEICVVYTDLDNQSRSGKFNNLTARVWQHEMDHLRGKMIYDRGFPIDRYL